MFWDRDLPGFGVRVYASGRKVYVVQMRGPAGGPRRVAVGRHGEVSPDKARREAAEIIDRIQRGEEPFPEPEAPEPTVTDLAERYMTAHVEVNCRPGTVDTFGRVVRLYILPELGHLALTAVDRSHVAALHYKMRDKPYQANQTVSVLAKMFKLAEAWGMTPPRRNPCRSVRHYKEHRRERFLTPEEYRRLGRVLREAETDGGFLPSGIAAIRLLLLTGCRKNEIVTLRWDDIDRTAGEIRISDSKTGARRVPLTPAVERVLAGIPRIEGNPWIIAGQNPGDHLKNLDQIWLRLRPRAGLDDVRIHDARHSFASRGAGDRGIASDDRKAARSSQGDDDGTLRALGAGYGEGRRGEGRRQHRRRHPGRARRPGQRLRQFGETGTGTWRGSGRRRFRGARSRR